MDCNEASFQCRTPDRRIRVAKASSTTRAIPGDLSMYNDSYFEDDYCLTFDTQTEKDDSILNIIHDMLSRTYPPYSSSTGGNHDVPEAAKKHALSRQVSVPNDLNTDQVSSTTGLDKSMLFHEAEEYVAEKLGEINLNDENVEEDRLLTDEDIQNLAPLDPAPGSLHLVFELTMETSQLSRYLADQSMSCVDNKSSVALQNMSVEEANAQINAETTQEAPVLVQRRPAGIERLPSVESGYSSNPVSPSEAAKSGKVFSKQEKVFKFPPFEDPTAESSPNLKAPFKKVKQNPSPDVTRNKRRFSPSPVQLKGKDQSPRVQRSARKCLRTNFELAGHDRPLTTLPEASSEGPSSGSPCSSEKSSSTGETNKDNFIDTRDIENLLFMGSPNLTTSFNVDSGNVCVANKSVSKKLFDTDIDEADKAAEHSTNNAITYSINADLTNSLPDIDDRKLGFPLTNICFDSPMTKIPTPISTSSPLQPPKPRQKNSETPRTVRLLLKRKSPPDFLTNGDSYNGPTEKKHSLDKENEIPRPNTSRKPNTTLRRRLSSPTTKVISADPPNGLKEPLRETNQNAKNSAAPTVETNRPEQMKLPSHSTIGSSPRNRDYIILKSVADAIFQRIPITDGEQRVLSVATLIEHLNEIYQSEISSLNVSKEQGLRAGILVSLLGHSNSCKARRSIAALKSFKTRQFDSFRVESLTISNCMKELTGALLVNHKSAVNECCDFIYRNLHYVSAAPDFLNSSPEIVMMLLSNPHSMVLGPHGFPLPFHNSEREVVEAINRYTKHRATRDKTNVDKRLKSYLMATVDSRVCERYNRYHHRNQATSQRKRRDIEWSHPGRRVGAPRHRRYSVEYETSKQCVTSAGTREEYFLLPSLSTSAFSSSYRRCENDLSSPPSSSGGRPKAANQTHCSREGELHPTNKVARPVPLLNLDDVCHNAYTLRRVYISTQRRDGDPYITGLGFEYACRGRREYVAMGTCQEGEEYGIMVKRPLCARRDAKPAAEEQDCFVTDLHPEMTSVKLGTGEHVIEVNVQGSAVLHNVEFVTNKGRRVRAHNHEPAQNATPSSLRWTKVEAPPTVTSAWANKSSGPFCLQAMTAEVKRVDTTVDYYMKNISAVWAVVTEDSRQDTESPDVVAAHRSASSSASADDASSSPSPPTDLDQALGVSRSSCKGEHSCGGDGGTSKVDIEDLRLPQKSRKERQRSSKCKKCKRGTKVMFKEPEKPLNDLSG